MMEKEIRELLERDDLDEIRAELMAKPNVHRTGVGYRFVDGEMTDEPAVFAYVDNKLSVQNLSDDELVPKETNGVRTDVREVEPGLKFEQDKGAAGRRERIRPIAGGSKLAKPDGSYGTIALSVQDNSTGNYGALTAHHVVSNDDGTTATMYQPTENTSQSDNNLLGDVTKSTPASSNDWAFVELDNQSQVSNKLIGMGEVTTIEEPRFDSRLVLNSCRQGLTGGQLTAVGIQGSARTDYEYRVDEDVDLGGTSGGAALWYDSDAGEFKLFAMHVASATANTNLSYGNTFDEIMNNGGFSLISGNYDTGLPESTNVSFEATPIDITTSGVATIRVVNVGNSTGTRTVEMRNSSTGRTIESQSVTLGAMDYTDIQMTAGAVSGVTVDTTDQSYAVDISRYVGDWTLEAELPEESGQIYGITVDSDENYVAVAPNGTYIEIYEYGTWNFLTTLNNQSASNEPVSSQAPTISFSGDGNWLAVGMSQPSSGSGEASIFDVSSSNPSNWSYETGLSISGFATRAVDFSEDSRFIVGAESGSGSPLVVWETGTWNHVVTKTNGSYGRSASFSPDDRFVALGSSNGNVNIYEVGDASGNGWNAVTELTQSSATLGGLDWSDTMDYITYGTWGNTCYVHNVGDASGSGWGLEQQLSTNGSLYAPKFSRDGDYLAVPEGVLAGDDEFNNVDVYSTEDWSSVASLESASEPIEDLFFTGSRLLYGARDGISRIHTGPLGPLPGPRNLEVTLQ